jgi:putative tryptophan/tyrosine transport system substrate-binding protein
MRRREFITLLGVAAAWPMAARAQQPERMRRIGVFLHLAADDPESQVGMGTFLQRLQELGWTVGRNLRVDHRWGATDPDLVRRAAAELVALAPDVILASGGTPVRALQQATKTYPIVFVAVTDPVGGGLVASLARPGNQTTGFTLFEYGMSTKWLELLKEISPQLTRAAVIVDPGGVGGGGQFEAIQAAAPSMGIQLNRIDARNPSEIERSIDSFAHDSNGGMIVTAGKFAELFHELIISLAAQHRLPAVYPLRRHVSSGGLLAYGPNQANQFWRAAGYVDRILKGEKASDLPLQTPIKYELAINLKTAKALGLDVPPTLLARADEVIE